MRDYLASQEPDLPAAPAAGAQSAPRPGHGAVFVRPFDEQWVALWQDDDAFIEHSGDKDEVLRWAFACEAEERYILGADGEYGPLRPAL